jgi:hypothetical protein
MSVRSYEDVCRIADKAAKLCRTASIGIVRTPLHIFHILLLIRFLPVPLWPLPVFCFCVPDSVGIPDWILLAFLHLECVVDC